MKRKTEKATFKKGLITGLGWAVGVTVGFALVSTLLVFVLRGLGGLPIVGNWIADVVESTQESLTKRTPLLPN